jgi:hypothetical protein
VVNDDNKPVAITLVVGANTSGWGATNITLWALVSLAIIIAVVIYFFKQVSD